MTGWDTLPLGKRTINLDRRRVPVTGRDRKPGPYPYYGASGVVDYVADYLFDGIHLLIAEDGENLRTRKTPVAFLANGRFWVNNHAHIVQANDDNNLRYLAYAVEASDLSAFITGSTQPKLSQAALNEIPIFAPPLAEQQRIAATLGSLDDKIESNRRAIAVSEALAAAQFEAMFDSEHDPAGVPISALLTVNAKRPLPKGTLATYVGMASLPEFSAEIYDWEDREFGSGAKFVNGDVLMARITPCLENGKTAVVDMLDDGEVGWGSTEYIVFSPDDSFSTSWIYCLLRTESVRAWAIRSMTGTSGRQRFQVDALDHYKVPHPSNDDLAQFNALTIPLFARITQLRDEVKRLIALRDTLLPELLSGRMRVPEVLAS